MKGKQEMKDAWDEGRVKKGWSFLRERKLGSESVSVKGRDRKRGRDTKVQVAGSAHIDDSKNGGSDHFVVYCINDKRKNEMIQRKVGGEKDIGNLFRI